MNARQARAPFGALSSALLAAACSLAPPPSVPEPAAELPDRFAGGEARAHEAREWWTSFQDPALNAVVDSALAANFDLAEALARVRQARIRAGIARAPLMPAIQASASVAEAESPSNAGLGQQFDEAELGGFGITLPERIGFETWSLGVGFAYELDFWGRARNDALAAGQEYLASESDYRTARIGVLSETIATYFEIADLRRRTTLARAIVDVLLEREELAEIRYDRGLATSFELRQVRQELRNTQAALPQLESQLVGAEGRLAVLIGGFRGKLDAILPDSLAPMPNDDPVSSGVPADLLVQRPDVRAASLRLDAARLSVGARRAEMLPSLSFSGTIGVQSADAGGVFKADQWFRNLLGNLTAPIFQGGRIRNNIALAVARFDQAAAAYGRTVVTAVHEVEAALAALDNEGRRHGFLVSQREEALASVELRSRRYAAGVGGYVDYLDAVRTLLGVESTLAAARRDLALARLAVHRSLGGDWTAPPEQLEPRMAPAAGSEAPTLSPVRRTG